MCEKCEQVEVEEDVIDVEIGENESGDSGQESKEVKTGELKISEEDLNAIEQMLLMDEIENRVIYLADEISPDLCQEAIQLIHKFNREDEGLPYDERTPIKVYISSGGGSVYDGGRLKSCIQGSQTPVFTILEGGIAFSMGLVLWQSGHVRVATKGATALYHTIRAQSPTQTLGEMQVQLKHFEKVQDEIDEFLFERTKGGLSKKKLKKKRKSNLDWYISSDQFEKYNLVDVMENY